MIAIDTNVLVRYVVADDPDQARRARRLVAGNEVILSATVLLESAWVLRSAYGYDSASIAGVLRRFLGLPNVKAEAPSRFARALDAWEADVDFADALHLAGIAGDHVFYTFDRHLAKGHAVMAGTRVSLVPS